MKILEKINGAFARFESWFLVLVVLVMVLLAFAQVLLRNLFDQSFLWGDAFLRHLVLWVGFVGASLATRDEKHINIDVFGRLLKGRAQVVAKIITQIASVVVCYFLADASYTFVMDERMYGSTLFDDIPSWYFQVIIPIGFALMGLRFLLLALYNVVALKPREEVS